MPAAFPLPVGLRLNQTAHAVERAFDEALGEADLTTLGTLLDRLAANAGAGEATPPWAGLAERPPE